VEEIAESTDTTYTDSLLDGNREYSYRIHVRTSREDEEGVTSGERSGIFHELERTEELPALSNQKVQAIGLALDDEDRMWVGVTTISSTTSSAMQEGIRVHFPGQTSSVVFREMVPDARSPIRMVAGHDRVYAAVKVKDQDSILVGCIGDDRQERWSKPVPAGQALPAGLYLEEDGVLLLVDSEALLYRFDPEGAMEGPGDGLQKVLVSDQGVPLGQALVAPGVGPSGLDQFMLQIPARGEHQILGRTQTTPGRFGGRTQFYEDGVGMEDGQTVEPTAMAFDRSRIRLMVVDVTGRLQVMDARYADLARRYVTKWGGFGAGSGEFQVSPRTAVALAVDSESRVYVADGVGEGGRVQVFAP